MAFPETKGIYLRGRIYWMAYQRRGKRVFISLETSDLAEAIRRAADARTRPELNEGGLLRAEIDRFVRWKQHGGAFTRQTVTNARNALNHMAASVGNVPPAAVTRADAKRFYDALRLRLTNESARTYIACARSFFAWAVQVARVARADPFAGLELPKLVSVARKDFCNAALRNRLIAECPREDLRFVLFCGFHAGLRRNEIVEARPEWFDLGHRLIHVKKLEPAMAKARGLDAFDLKDREERTIPLSDEFGSFLRGWLHDGAYCLAPDRRLGTSRYRYDFISFFRDYMAAQDCPWVTPHVMRHTFASLAATNGVSIYIISQWLGDDVRTTQRHYARLAPGHEDIARALK